MHFDADYLLNEFKGYFLFRDALSMTFTKIFGLEDLSEPSLSTAPFVNSIAVGMEISIVKINLSCSNCHTSSYQGMLVDCTSNLQNERLGSERVGNFQICS